MRHECRLNFDGRKAVPRNVDHIVNAPQNVHVALIIDLRTVTGEEPAARTVVLPIGIQVALRVAPDGACHGGADLIDHNEALFAGLNEVTVLVHHAHRDAGDFAGGASGKGSAVRGTFGEGPFGREGGVVWPWGADGRAGLGLPPRIDKRCGTPTHVLAQPLPRLRVNGLAHRPEQTHS